MKVGIMQDFENRLKGGHPNSLGNTIEVVNEVLAENEYFNELFKCYFSHDEVVRLRTSNAMKRICKDNKLLLVPYIDKFITDIAAIDQASAQWTIAQLFDSLKNEMSDQQIQSATKIMKKNLETHNDWIVLNASMETLGKWSNKQESLRKWLIPILEKHAEDERKSVSSRARKILKRIE